MSEAAARFAPFVATLGRGPGRSRALTRGEAREAFGMVLRGEPDPHQVGAFLMLLRYRGEDADEVAGLVEAARGSFTAPVESTADLDWPSYGAGKTRGVPWFLLAALALARAGVRVLMHGANDFTTGVDVARALTALGMTRAANPEDAAARLERERFAYLPLGALSPGMQRLLRLRELFGLRSPVNTVARLLDPANARAGVDGVFHPPYIDVHLGVAARLGRPRLAVLKGGGGEAERAPAKPILVSLWDAANGRSELTMPAWDGVEARPAREDDPAALASLWRGETTQGEATVLGTIALGLLALGHAATPEAADRDAVAVWRGR